MKRPLRTAACPPPRPQAPRPHHGGRRYAQLYLEGLSDDPVLSAREKLLLTIILDKQNNSRGRCFAGCAKLGGLIGCAANYVRALIRSINAHHEQGLTPWHVECSRRGPGRTWYRRARYDAALAEVLADAAEPPRRARCGRSHLRAERSARFGLSEARASVLSEARASLIRTVSEQNISGGGEAPPASAEPGAGRDNHPASSFSRPAPDPTPPFPSHLPPERGKKKRSRQRADDPHQMLLPFDAAAAAQSTGGDALAAIRRARREGKWFWAELDGDGLWRELVSIQPQSATGEYLLTLCSGTSPPVYEQITCGADCRRITRFAYRDFSARTISDGAAEGAR